MPEIDTPENMDNCLIFCPSSRNERDVSQICIETQCPGPLVIRETIEVKGKKAVLEKNTCTGALMSNGIKKTFEEREEIITRNGVIAKITNTKIYLQEELRQMQGEV